MQESEAPIVRGMPGKLGGRKGHRSSRPSSCRARDANPNVAAVPQQRQGTRAPRRKGSRRTSEPLEHKLFSVYGQILNERALRDAWEKVRANKGAGGVDGVTIARFEEDLDGNIARLLADLRAKTYRPSPVRRAYIPKKNGKRRPLGIPTIRDRIVQQALVTRLSPFFEENVFHRDSCGSGPGMGVEDALKKVMWNLETGHRYVYDLDIKGYFDNIPHKKLMRVLNKYVSDGTVLDLVWRSLKAGYMEDDVTYETAAGTMQGGVISPLLANIYLNELDWEPPLAGLRFCRYADDCIVMCRDEAELERAVVVVGETVAALGLELSAEKTRVVDTREGDFDYLSFTFRRAHTFSDGNWKYWVTPTEASLTKFRRELKARTKKTYSKSFEQWAREPDPVIRGKSDYFLAANRAAKAVWGECRRRGMGFHGQAKRSYDSLDAYVRQRLRVNIANRGKGKHAGQHAGKLMTVRYGNGFFLKEMGLVSGQYMADLLRNPGLTPDEFLASRKRRRKWRGDPKTERFFAFANAR